MLNNFFSPKSIAVIGASRNKKKLGFLVYENIKKYGYKGKIYPVNIKGGKVNAQKIFRNILEIEANIDLGVVVVPAAVVPQVVKECGQKGISSVIIISAGFSEIGGKGKKLEQSVRETAEKYGVRVVGPNCLGIIDSWSKLNASFAESMPDKMNISFFSQSGAICTAILDWANMNGIGFSRFISLGNKLDIDENEIMQFLKEDEKTDIVLGYLESINDGAKFMANASELSKRKPVVMVKSGRTKEGAKSISSHTGSIAGSDLVIDAAMKQSGIVRATSLEDLFDYAKIFAFSPHMKGNKVAVVSNAGGPAVMSADAISKSRLQLAKLSDKTIEILEETLPEEAATHNPIDVVGDARADRYESALHEILKDEDVDAVLVVLTPQVMTEVEVTANLVAKLKKYKKPIAVSFMGGERVNPGRIILEEKEVPSYEFPERAVKALEALYQYHRFKNHIPTEKKPKYLKFEKSKAGAIINQAFQNRRGIITDTSFDIFEHYGIRSAKRVYGVGLEELKESAGALGYPIVVKSSAKGILHRSEIGAVKQGIKNEAELQRAYFSIRDSVRKHGFEEYSDKIDIYKMEEEGIQIFLGAKKDPSFGPLIIFGLGGIFVEALQDFSYRIGPVTHLEAMKMISEIKSQKVLNGFRGMPEVDREKVADAIVGLSWLMADFPEIKEIDINPLMVTDTKCLAVDGKIILDLEASHVLELVS